MNQGIIEMRIKIKIKLDEGAFTPVKAYDTDGGIDLKAMHGQRIMPNSSAVFRTGVHVELPPGTCGLLVSKSGLCVNKQITSTGLIDEGFSGEIKVRLFNHGYESYLVSAGDKITQLVILPVIHGDIEIVDHIQGGERGDNGYGSSGR